MQRILIADDAIFMREILREIVEPLGYEVVAEAASGLEAVELFALYQPDLMILDLVMPKGSGIDATRMVLNRFPAAKIVVAAKIAAKTAAKAESFGWMTFPCGILTRHRPPSNPRRRKQSSKPRRWKMPGWQR